jgi:GR25 family glycosyltransferase involved in LPS biosynthesis
MSVDFPQKVLFLNLLSRNDRLVHIQQQLIKLGWQNRSERIDAFSVATHGQIGCTMSHLHALYRAKYEQWESVAILEDDFLMVDDPTNFVARLQMAREALANRWDVLMLAGNVQSITYPVRVNQTLVAGKIHTALAGTGYIVQKAYLDTLIRNMEQALKRLLFNPYAIQGRLDVCWQTLQQRDQWFILLPLSVTQLKGRSDIENKEVDYDAYMLTVGTPRRK